MKNFIIENMETIKTYINENHLFVIWKDQDRFKIRKINEDYGYCFEDHIVTTEESFSELVCINHLDHKAIILQPYYDFSNDSDDKIVNTIQCHYDLGIGTVHDYIDEDIICSMDYFLEAYGKNDESEVL